jgi:hypothetical protein
LIRRLIHWLRSDSGTGTWNIRSIRRTLRLREMIALRDRPSMECHKRRWRSWRRIESLEKLTEFGSCRSHRNWVCNKANSVRICTPGLRWVGNYLIDNDLEESMESNLIRALHWQKDKQNVHVWIILVSIWMRFILLKLILILSFEMQMFMSVWRISCDCI